MTKSGNFNFIVRKFDTFKYYATAPNTCAIESSYLYQDIANYEIRMFSQAKSVLIAPVLVTRYLLDDWFFRR